MAPRETVVAPERQFEELGVIVHTVLTVLHLIGFAYNVRREQYLDAAAHLGGVAYDGLAVRTHLRNLRRLPCPSPSSASPRSKTS